MFEREALVDTLSCEGPGQDGQASRSTGEAQGHPWPAVTHCAAAWRLTASAHVDRPDSLSTWA
jgi:hypothetical protein